MVQQDPLSGADPISKLLVEMGQRLRQVTVGRNRQVARLDPEIGVGGEVLG